MLISCNVKINSTVCVCSCFGVINSLNGEAEPGVLVEAVGRGSGECDLLQEECKTEQDGTFRIRGLLVSSREPR